jgi:cation transport ATPase
MKLNILLSLLFLFSVKSISQTKSTVIIVDGVCMMCENRIEKKAIDKKGIKLADWNLENRTLKLVYNEKHISVDEIHKFFASIGHDTKKEIASDDAYSLLDPCCKYRDLQVIRDHGLDREPINRSTTKE